MSFAEKIGAIMQRPGQDPVAKDDVPWWMKYAGRGLGTVGSIIAIVFGLWNCFGLLVANVSCLISGMWQMVAAFMVIIVEAPCCCMFIDFVQNISDWVEKRPYWNRGAFYVTIALPAVIICPNFSSIIGSGFIFTTGVIYGLMALGRKASAEEMRSNAVIEQQAGIAMGRSGNLVDNAQPISITSPPKSPFEV